MSGNNNSKAPKGTLGKVFGYIKNYRALMIVSVIMAALSVGLTLYVPIVIGQAIDLIAGQGNVDFNGIAALVARAAAAVAGAAVLQWLMNLINNRVTYHVVRDMRETAFRKIQSLPLKYLDAHKSGETLNRIISDADQFSDGLLMGFTQLFTSAASILGTLIFMLTISPKITLAVVALTPLSLFIARFIANRTYDMFTLQSKIKASQTAFIDEMTAGLKTVRAFGREEKALERFDEINGELEKCSLRATFFSSITNPSTRFVNNAVYAAVALAGALTCISTAGTAAPFTVGQLSCFLSYANQYTKPFNEISGVIAELQNAFACAARLFEFIEEDEETPDPPDAAVLENARGSVALDGVDFSYLPDKKLIEGLDLIAEPGKRVAIVGPTGCGKTTVINLLMRFYDVNGGEIRVDGRDIRDITRHSLRSSYGMVLQETWLKSGTVRENIAMGKPDASDGEIIAAAKAAHAHSFIKRLPDGYGTVIGEDGGSLSQGQKQLLCITRVMLCLPPMLILDEATSSIDTRTEIKIQQAFARLMEGRTSFIVAHRLSTIQEADIILVMKDGHIVEQGDHKTLLEKGGFYSKLYNSQFAN
ncbi:MAG: ABC transporter ATP-binding protein/permease [Ruminococcus sp.]|nr:ABC transporter ATP-binding protein/permease [Ruminococcus sp.]